MHHRPAVRVRGYPTAARVRVRTVPITIVAVVRHISIAVGVSVKRCVYRPTVPTDLWLVCALVRRSSHRVSGCRVRRALGTPPVAHVPRRVTVCGVPARAVSTAISSAVYHLYRVAVSVQYRARCVQVPPRVVHALVWRLRAAVGVARKVFVWPVLVPVRLPVRAFANRDGCLAQRKRVPPARSLPRVRRARLIRPVHAAGVPVLVQALVFVLRVLRLVRPLVCAQPRGYRRVVRARMVTVCKRHARRVPSLTATIAAGVNPNSSVSLAVPHRPPVHVHRAGCRPQRHKTARCVPNSHRVSIVPARPDARGVNHHRHVSVLHWPTPLVPIV